MKRPLPLLLLAALVIAAPAHAATATKRYTAWNDLGDPLIKRFFQGSGECPGASAVSSRADAWRCVSGTIALDPCFLSPTDEEVLCVKAPWAREGHLLSVLIEPDDRGNSAAPDVWALRVGRRRCTYIPGPAKRKGPSYRCGRGKRGPFLFGRPSRRKKTWTIRSARNRQGRGARRAKIRTAWT